MYQIYCEAPRTLDICLNRLLTSVLEWPVLSVQSLLCLHLRPHIAYLSRASMPTRLTVLSMVQPLSFEPRHSMLVLQSP